MCNKITCAIQHTVDLLNNNINRDVQEECANGYVHIAAIRMMEKGPPSQKDPSLKKEL